MVRSLLLTITMLLSAGAVIAQTILAGKITDEATKEELIGASVKVIKGGETVKGSITDFNGSFRIPLDPGKYDVEVTYTGYTVARVNGVQVLANTLNYQNFSLAAGNVLGEVVIKDFKVPLIRQDATASGQELTSDQIKNLPTRSVAQIVATTAGTTSIDGGDVSIKGSRSNATNYYIDGIRVQGSPPPVQDLEQLQVITGGLGAEYGDVTGGVISLTTKGPASDYHGAVEMENSYGLDAFGWLLATANVSGPIVKKKLANGATRTVVGFRMSGQLLNQKDDDPPATPVYRAKESVLARLNQHPLTRENGAIIPSGEQLTNDSVDIYNYRPFEKRRDIDVTGKLDFRLSDAIDLSVTGTYKDIQNLSTPDPEGTGRPTARLLNSQNNPTDYNSRYRGIARFRHRLGTNEASKTSSGVSISNASYQIQFGFERGLERRYDPRHKDRLFDYGYVGRFNFDYVSAIEGNPDDGFKHVGFTELFRTFQPGYGTEGGNSTIPNPGLVAYNEFATEGSEATYVVRNGIFTDQYNDIWGNFHNNINRPYSTNSKKEEDVVTIMASSGFDLKLGKSGTHNIQFGLINEQRTFRSHSVSPFGLWNLMDQSANIHFNGIDTIPLGKIQIEVNGVLLETDSFGIKTSNQPDNKFYREVRKALGPNGNPIALTEWVNVNEYGPDNFRLDMFSSRELTEQRLVNYYGYDYLGNKLADGVSFNDFFTARDADGIRTFPVAPLQPLYQAAYLKDKFTFNNMIFSLGFRVERFDLNTKVMRDQYSLYKIKTAQEYYATTPGTRPGTIGDDFKVYVASAQTPTLKAFRDGDTWYYADGRQANDGFSVLGSQPVAPLYQDTVNGDDIFKPGFNPDLSFEDYTPQVNWLPRLAFSFPISEDANFFAHYDILVQRPPDGWQVTPLNYLYFNVGDRTPVNNASLRPERVVDYEVGFQQKLNQNSALKFSAYYREMRDMIQRRTIGFVPTISRYDTYGNVDFGTVKGFTVQYDLRRIQNAELRLAYTLQFADGTGSDQNSQNGLTSRGNIRTLYPLNFDERHNISGILDYRFANGKQYNGPVVGGKDILSNFGVNMQLIGASGRPYTAKTRPTRYGGEGTVGAINGNRKPWRLTLDARVDKSFNLSAAGKRPLNVNVYFRVSNLLNRKNVVDVYPVNGSATDDGWLATAEARSIINGLATEGRNTQAYLAAYSWALLDPNNFTLPRRMYVGAVLEF